ncbi:hypothetical protein WN55_05797 [Dufourea novaeangliae]|uniref:Uncharacterized protein n=1 Tax=Dufourea novaeangliae TaxID=178035 RepID=A0A154P034_DUFNO|nr:hypothetical protein WN55_05797 [Dufourea novaeangliae]
MERRRARWMQNPEAIFHSPSCGVYRLEPFRHTPFALRCASPMDSSPFTSLDDSRVLNSVTMTPE